MTELDTQLDASEMQMVDGGGNGTICGLAVGAALGLALVLGPESLFFTGGKVVAACIVDAYT